jgi:hypothetical protein
MALAQIDNLKIELTYLALIIFALVNILFITKIIFLIIKEKLKIIVTTVKKFKKY